jgi:predicted dehydrogenase
LIGAGRMFIDETSRVLRSSDIPPEAVLDRRQRAKRMLEKATGNAPLIKQNAYRHMCGLNCHDLSAMREIIGFPKRVVSAVQWNEGKFVNAIFEFEGYFASFETGVDSNRRFDAHIQVYGEQKAVTVQYNTPYIRHLPTTRIVEETVDEAFSRAENRPSFKDAYTVELEYFHKVVNEGKQPKTSIEDAREDLKLIRMIVDALE